MNEMVILVDESDKMVGEEDKVKVKKTFYEWTKK